MFFCSHKKEQSYVLLVTFISVLCASYTLLKAMKHIYISEYQKIKTDTSELLSVYDKLKRLNYVQTWKYYKQEAK